MKEEAAMIGGVKQVQAKAGREAEFETAFAALRAQVARNEPGTLSYELFRDGASGRYIVLDRYRDAEALAAHSGSPANAAAFGQLRGLLERLDVRYFPAPGRDSYTAVALTKAPVDRAFALAADIEALPRWSTRFCLELRREGGGWIVRSPQGEVRFRLEADAASRTVFHCVDTGAGELRMPLRVAFHGPSALLLFTIRRPPGATEADFLEQCGWVDEELGRLRDLAEAD